jgi:hypothetical protein
MTAKLRIADDLALPVDGATQTFAFIGRKRSGKTYGAGKLVEQLLAARVQTVVLDTVGNWYGLRLAADGKGPSGFDVPIFGGLRGDVALNPQAGELVADVLADTARSAVIDVSQFTGADRKRFAAAFGERLWQRKKAEAHPAPVHLVIEECQLVIPQFVGKDEARMVGVYEQIVRLGGNYGVGVSMITQRPQSVNKEALTQTECLFAFQVNGVPERKAIREWVTHQGLDVALVDELPGLPVGTAYVWSPQWLGILRKVRIGAKQTLDASSTPKVGEHRERRNPAPLDLAGLGQRMAALVEEAKANDPAALKRRVAELEKQLAARPTAERVVEKVVTVEVPVLKNGQLDRTEGIVGRLEAVGQKALAEAAELRRLIAPAAAPRQPIDWPAGKHGHPAAPGTRLPTAGEMQAAGVRPSPKPAPVKQAPAGPPADGITPRQQRFLDAAATLATLGADVTRETVCGWVGVHPRGGSVGEELKALEAAGLLTNDRGRLAVTAAGMAAAGQLDPAEAIERAKAGLEPRQAKFFKMIVEAYPEGLTREQIAGMCDPPIHPRGGSLGEDLGRLVGRGLVDRDRGTYRARDFLFAGATS